ncbi:MAG: hypothetical protein Fur0042_18850 [Cyanophyceae cyanobacterium]
MTGLTVAFGIAIALVAFLVLALEVAVTGRYHQTLHRALLRPVERLEGLMAIARSAPQNPALVSQTVSLPWDDLADGEAAWLAAHLDGQSTAAGWAVVFRGDRVALLAYPALLLRSVPANPAAAAPTLLTALGVLGTFAGISAGLQGLDLGAIAATDDLLRASGTLLAGMGTAFLTSLWGLGSASGAIVILALGDRVRRTWRDRLRQRLDRVAVLVTNAQLLGQIRDRFTPTDRADHPPKGSSVLPPLDATALAQTLAMELDRAFAQPALDLLRQHRDREADTTAVLQQLSDRLGHLDQQIGRSNDAIATFQATTLERLETLDRQQQQRLQDTFTQLNHLLAATGTTLAQQGDAIAQIGDEAARTMDRAADALRQSLDQVADAGDQQRRALVREISAFQDQYRAAIETLLSEENQLLRDLLRQHRQELLGLLRDRPPDP